ncbi:Rv3654c family TadE-like protein [Kineococcus gynurae]|uniref:Rv3654c family TadE-like protein n=1 Tax=Kineococcus gynurae TaxID=452979 RepID=UPI0035EEA842
MGGPDAGSGSALVLGITALALGAALTVAGLGAATTARHRATAAADLAALAAADVALGRSPGGPATACGRAGEVATAGSARLVGCRVSVVDGSPVVDVSTAVDLPGALHGLGPARASARAGAQPTRTGS